MSLYLPYDQDGLIELEISLTQNEDYKWVVEAEILQNLVFEDQDDPRRLARFADLSSQYSHVMSPMDDRWIPMLPQRNSDGLGCVNHIQLILDSQSEAQEAYNGILACLDEYIRSKKALADDKMTVVEERWIERA